MIFRNRKFSDKEWIDKNKGSNAGTPKRLIQPLIKIIVSLGLIIYLYNRIGFEALIDNINEIPYKVVLGALFLYNASVILNALKWKCFLDNVKISVLIKTVYKSQLFSTILPGQLFGEASKIASLKTESISAVEITSSVIFDKISSLFIVLLTGLAGLLLSAQDIDKHMKYVFLAVSMLLFIVLLFPKISICHGLILKIIKAIEDSRFKLIRVLASVFKTVYLSWSKYVSSSRRLIAAFLLGLVSQLFGILQMSFIAGPLGIQVSFWDFMWILSVVSFVLLIPVSVGGVGIRDASIVGMLNALKVPEEKSLVLSFLIFLSQLSAAVVGAVIVLIDHSKTD